LILEAWRTLRGAPFFVYNDAADGKPMELISNREKAKQTSAFPVCGAALKKEEESRGGATPTDLIRSILWIVRAGSRGSRRRRRILSNHR